MKKYLFFATALVALASCSDDNFVGNNNPIDPNGQEGTQAIVFNSGAKTLTRADHVGADAASLLNNKFIVGGFKGTYDYSGNPTLENVTVATGTVFDNYIVNWGANTAGTTTSNTSDWEYVGTTAAAPSGIAGNNQSIKYWDYTATQYDFIAYSTGGASVTTTLSTDADIDAAISRAIDANQIHVTAIDPKHATTAAYKLSGNAADLEKCYIADMVTVYKDGTDGMHYQDEVKLTFRNLASKVRIAIYETVPGYSVKDVKFYSNASTSIATGTDNENATLFTTGTNAKDNFYTAGTYTVNFPNIGKGKVTPTKNSDYNKAHASFAVVGEGKTTTKSFGTLQKVGRDYKEVDGTNYIGRTSTTASFAGTAAPYYQIAMPNEEGTVLELRVDYTLLSIDGSGEEIHVHGATAYIPAIYAQWKSNYAYTYIFKISDNTNGWTSTVETDPKGLYPITFDAIVMETQDFTQSTITNVSTPSITTYQKGHVYNVADPGAEEYSAVVGDIYIQVMNDGTLATNLEATGISKLYTLAGKTSYTEADVLETLSLKLSESGSPITITGRNGVELTEATIVNNIAAIPGPDGNDIEVAAGTAAKFTPAAGTYAYVYDTKTYAGDYYPAKPADWDAKYNTDYYTNAACTTHPASSTFAAGTYYKKTKEIGSYIELTSAPSDWKTDATNPYYSDEACTTQITGTFSSHHEFALTAKPADWDDGVYYTNSECTTPASSTYSDATYYKKVKCYRKYTIDKKVYGVKVIKVKA